MNLTTYGELMNHRGSKRSFLNSVGVAELAEGVDVFLRWSHPGGHDGTCRGMCQIGDESYAYEIFVSVEARRRAFAVIALTPEQRTHNVQHHARYVSLFGEGLDYEYHDRTRKHGSWLNLTNAERSARYDELSAGPYSLPIMPKELYDNPIVGWFEL